MTDQRPVAPDERAVSHREPDDLQYLVHHAELPHTALSLVLDRIIRTIGSGISWIWLVLIAVIMLNVTMRYAFGQGRIEFEEILLLRTPSPTSVASSMRPVSYA